MTPLAGQPILTAVAMRAAENAAIARGASVARLMERAGQAIAIAVRRLGGANAVLILCGPGNNGGDGYSAARLLRNAGVNVRVAALGEPRGDAAMAARAGWPGPVESFADALPAPILIDALFGTGLTRALDARRGADPADGAAPIADKLAALVQAATLSIAIDLPSGAATDTGAILGPVPHFDITLALGAAKPAHLLQPAASHCGAVRLLDIGVATSSDVNVLQKPDLSAPSANAHKYTRGMVAVVGGAMPGAARLAGIAARRAGAGYVLLLADDHAGPDALVCKPFSISALSDRRINTLLIGPGLGRDDDARAKLAAALAMPHAMVIDGDALHLLDPALLADREAPTILTPHAGEFDAMFSREGGHSGAIPTVAGPPASKIDRTRAAAVRAGSTIVHKGADTVIAAPDGTVIVAPAASPWLSTAGTGDVLAGAIAAMLATGMPPREAAAAGVWMHGEAARRLGAAFIADDLAFALTTARAAL